MGADLLVDVLVAGDRGAGKTSVIERCVNDRFSPEYFPTTAAPACALRKCHASGHTRHRHPYTMLRLWDTAHGNTVELFQAAPAGVGRGLVLIVFDSTSRDSYRIVERVWLRAAALYAPTASVAVVATRCDNPNSRVTMRKQPQRASDGGSTVRALTRAVHRLFGRDDWRERHPEVPVFECDCSSGRGIEEAFAAALALHYQRTVTGAN